MPTIPKNPKFPFKAYGITSWSWPAPIQICCASIIINGAPLSLMYSGLDDKLRTLYWFYGIWPLPIPSTFSLTISSLCTPVPLNLTELFSPPAFPINLFQGITLPLFLHPESKLTNPSALTQISPLPTGWLPMQCGFFEHVIPFLHCISTSLFYYLHQ